MPYHNDTIIKTQEDFFINICTSHFIAKVRKGLLKVCVWEGAGDRTETVIFWPPLQWPSTLCLSRSPDAQPEALGSTLLGDGFLYCILSATSLVPKLPRPGRLSLPQLLSNWHSTVTQLLSWLRYIIVQRPLDLWNRMFNRHQVEITVMQFTSHSLLVHQSMSEPWEFFSSSHFISQFPPTRFSLITAIRMCHLLPVHHLGWHFWLGQKVKIQNLKSSRTRVLLFRLIT